MLISQTTYIPIHEFICSIRISTTRKWGEIAELCRKHLLSKNSSALRSRLAKGYPIENRKYQHVSYFYSYFYFQNWSIQNMKTQIIVFLDSFLDIFQRFPLCQTVTEQSFCNLFENESTDSLIEWGEEQLLLKRLPRSINFFTYFRYFSSLFEKVTIVKVKFFI